MSETFMCEDAEVDIEAMPVRLSLKKRAARPQELIGK